MFQSPPTPKGRCNSPCKRLASSLTLFQSPPTPKGRCNEQQLDALLYSMVSIPTHPEGQVQHEACRVACSLIEVSIPTHPEGQVQPG